EHLMAEAASLEAEIRRLIGLAGPMPVAVFVGHCLAHPRLGYYITHDPFGSGGGVPTPPHSSPMCGALLRPWGAPVGRPVDPPEIVQTIELGPGRRTMMLDMLRAANVMPDFRRAIAVHLVESSPVLLARQQQTLGNLDLSIVWHESLAEVPEGPSILVANEF